MYETASDYGHNIGMIIYVKQTVSVGIPHTRMNECAKTKSHWIASKKHDYTSLSGYSFLENQ